MENRGLCLVEMEGSVSFTPSVKAEMEQQEGVQCCTL